MTLPTDKQNTRKEKNLARRAVFSAETHRGERAFGAFADSSKEFREHVWSELKEPEETKEFVAVDSLRPMGATTTSAPATSLPSSDAEGRRRAIWVAVGVVGSAKWSVVLSDSAC